MPSRYLLFTAMILAAYAIGAIDAHSGQPAAGVQSAQQSGEILSRDEIIQRAKARQPGEVRQIALERKYGRTIYEVDIVDERGTQIEMNFDAKTGELISKKLEKDEDEDGADDDD